MTLPRFFAPHTKTGDQRIDLPPDEAEHLARVLRLGVGDEVRIFDGRGHEWVARVEMVGKRRATLTLVRPATPREEPRVSITLAPAVLKGESLDEVIRDATTLGAVTVQPVVAARSEVTRTSRLGAGRVERWRRIAVAAAKQCGRAVVPAIGPPEPITVFVQQLAARSDHARIMLVEPAAAGDGQSRAILTLSEYQQRHATRPEAATILIGPEGGWTSGEVTDATMSGCELVTLGRRTFRADATPLVALALFQFLWGDL